MAMSKKYWKGIDELQETSAFVESRDQEFTKSVSVDEFLSDENLAETSTARRDFLKFLGFSVAAATVAACEAPVTKAIPYVIKPENVTLGVPTWYASTYYDGSSYASILVKTREGRPIYIKGNREQGFTKGATNPQIIASVLGLYDSQRLKDPMSNGAETSWKSLDGSVRDGLKNIAKSGGKISVVSSSIISPSVQSALVELANSLYPSSAVDGMAVSFGDKFEVINYDSVSYAGMREANLKSFGMRKLPDYDFTKAKTIVSIGADFLGTWLLSNQYAAQYGERRKPEGEWMSKHYQFESIMSVTGSNADERGPIKVSEQANTLAYLIKGLGGSTQVGSELNAEAKLVANNALKSLKSSKGASIVVSGSNNVGIQLLTNQLNDLLLNYGKTISFTNAVNLFQSEDSKMQKLVSDVIAGKGPKGIVFIGTNPVYTLPNGAEFGKALKNVELTVSIANYADETASNVKHIASSHHALESWMDHNPKDGHYALSQPTIRPIFNTADTIESLLVWAGTKMRGGKDSRVAHDYISKLWEQWGYPAQSTFTDFSTYWGMAVHNSVSLLTLPEIVATFNTGSLTGIEDKLPKYTGIEVVFYQKMGLGDGQNAGNPWLQELPDPISKVTWDNYITMNPGEMSRKDLATTFDQESGLNLATVTVGGKNVTLPVYPSPGQVAGTIGIALGYGRGANGESIGNGAFQTKQYGGFEMDGDKKRSVGQNVYPMIQWWNGSYGYEASASFAPSTEKYLIGATQIHHTVMGRNSIVRETSLEVFQNEEPSAYNHKHVIHHEGKEVPISEFDLWDAHPVENIGHRWGMSVDLSSCIGCGSCLIACQSENNVPVVGKDEVRRGREMHWLRIDRYFASDLEATPGTRKDHGLSKMDYFEAAEVASNNPAVVHMPLMCHHCNHAPCETVCPVAATTHSNEGLNQMTYNRCIGTRYCANNCPYKVRRFNWFNYPSYKKFTEINPAQDDLGRMVLNPDVTVRTRGVMEKCSFCVQRIQSGKLVAKKEMRPVVDGDVVTACQDACPTNAIVVGDWNDTNSLIRKISEEKRAYQALEEVGVKPNVWYQVKVRNAENKELNKVVSQHKEEEAHAHHGGGHDTPHSSVDKHGEKNHKH
jgi:MoCo/4Fe-4S cofactor protein with predicted Tat translocation signal